MVITHRNWVFYTQHVQKRDYPVLIWAVIKFSTILSAISYFTIDKILKLRFGRGLALIVDSVHAPSVKNIRGVERASNPCPSALRNYAGEF